MQAEKRAHKAADSESKQKKQLSFDSTLGTTFEDNDGGVYHSQWCDHFRRLYEFKVQFGHCLVPQHYPADPKLGKWVSNQRSR